MEISRGVTAGCHVGEISKRLRGGELKLSKLNDQDEIKVYLTTFEQVTPGCKIVL